MFGIDSTEFLVIVVIAVIVIGPKDLPRALYKLGQIVGKAQGMARHFRTGIDAMVREVELEELEKKWAAQNQRIMQEHPALEAPADEAAAAADELVPAAAATATEEPASAFPGFPAPPTPAAEDDSPRGSAPA